MKSRQPELHEEAHFHNPVAHGASAALAEAPCSISEERRTARDQAAGTCLLSLQPGTPSSQYISYSTLIPRNALCKNPVSHQHYLQPQLIVTAEQEEMFDQLDHW